MHYYFLKKNPNKLKACYKQKSLKIQICVYIDVYMCSVCPEQSIPKLLLVLRFNTRSVLLLLSLFPSCVSAPARREILVEQLPNLLSPVPRPGSEAPRCPGALRGEAARRGWCTASPALAESGAVLRAHGGDMGVGGCKHKAGRWQTQHPSRKGRARREALGAFKYILGGKEKTNLPVWTLIQLLHNTGRCASCWRCKR